MTMTSQPWCHRDILSCQARSQCQYVWSSVQLSTSNTVLSYPPIWLIARIIFNFRDALSSISHLLSWYRISGIQVSPLWLVRNFMFPADRLSCVVLVWFLVYDLIRGEECQWERGGGDRWRWSPSRSLSSGYCLTTAGITSTYIVVT